MLNPLIKHRLSNVTTRAQANEVWNDHAADLEGYTFVLAEPSGEGALHFPARIDFPGGGFLRSVFVHDNLYLVNHHFIKRSLADGSVQIPVDYSVGFDSNVASYLRSFQKGRSGPVVDMLQSVFKALQPGRFNWSLMPFILERAEDILNQKDLDLIYQTQFASEWFAACDREHLLKTGEAKLREPVDQIIRRAQKALADWDRLLKNGMIKMIRYRHGLFHACLLKTVLLQLESPSSRKAGEKLRELLQFMDGEINGMFMLITRAALEFFSKGGAFKPMAKVASPSTNLLANVRNVTWDFVQVIWQQSYAGFHGRQSGFMVPYFLTFDHGLADLHDLYPQRSCLFGNELQFPIFFQELDMPALILGRHPELENEVAKTFTIPAAQLRDQQRESNLPKLPEIICDLERKLMAFQR